MGLWLSGDGQTSGHFAHYFYFAIKDPAAATAVTDIAGAIAWHPSFVRRANGAIKTFLNIDDPAYFGSIFSTAVRFGALIARNDNVGLVQIIETV